MMPTRKLAAGAAVTGILSGVLGLTLAVISLFFSGEPPMEIFFTLLIATAALALAMTVFLGLYMYFDARSRGMSGALSVLLLLLVGPPALVIYLLIRRPRVRTVHSAGAASVSD